LSERSVSGHGPDLLGLGWAAKYPTYLPWRNIAFRKIRELI